MTVLVQAVKNAGTHQVNMSGVTAGNGLVLMYVSSGTGHITSITDNQGNTWVQASGALATASAGGSGLFTDVWYCTAALSSGSCNIVIHVSGAGAPNNSYGYELQGALTFITASGLNGTGVAPNPAIITSNSISASGAIFISGAAQDNVFLVPTIPGPWVQGTMDINNDPGPTAYLLGSGSQTAVFTYGANWNNTTTKDYVISIAAFTASSLPTTGTITVQKATNPGLSPQGFTFTPSWGGGSFVLRDGQSNTSPPLTPGVYSVAEAAVAGWVISTSQNPNAITVTSGSATTVLFTNTFVNPVPPPPCAPVVNGQLTSGVLITDLSLFIGPELALYTIPLPPSVLTAYETINEGRKAIVIDFNQGAGVYSRDLGTVFSWPLNAGVILDIWQPSIIPMPEGIYGRVTDWIDAGSPNDKFIQGIQVEADSFGNAKTFQLQSSDDLSLHPLNEMPAIFNGQSIKSLSCAPFIAHSVRIVSTDGVEWRQWSEKLVFEPYPSSCMEWATERMSYGNGWQHIRMLNIPYIAAQPVTVTLFFDQWPDIVITNQLPSTVSQMYPTKQKVQVPPNKSKLMGFKLSSSAPFRVFKQQLEVWVGLWGRTGPYETVTPFGGDASDGARV